MKSVKPGRGPSFLNVVGGIVSIVFGIIWTLAAASMGAPFFFPLFGVVFIAVGIINTAYHFKNATGKERYSAFDIVDGDEEPDPLNARYGTVTRSYGEDGKKELPTQYATAYCPYCGKPTQQDHAYCRACGKALD